MSDGTNSATYRTNGLAEYVYEYNDANQRVDEVGDSYWIYEYDAFGQVKSGKKYWSDGTPVTGQQFVYSFDDNRQSVSMRRPAGMRTGLRMRA